MPFFIKDTTEWRMPGFGAADFVADLPPEEQLATICAEMARPVRAETVRRRLLMYWPLISTWAEERPEFFDAVIYQFVAEIEQRHASAPDGIRHLREIAKS